MLTLTAHDEARLPEDVRAEFLAWVKAEGLDNKWIIEGTFGEGVVRAKCMALDASGEPIWLDEEGTPLPPDAGWAADVALEERIFTVRTPPPSSLLPYLR